MKRVLGQLIWVQSRDIRVLNYPKTIVYEIYTNKGYLKVGCDKETNELYKIDELPLCTRYVKTNESVQDKSEKILLSPLK